MIRRIYTRFRDHDLEAVYEDGKLVELSCEPFVPEVQVGMLCIGKVQNVTPAIGAAFIEFADGEMGFLDYKKNPPPVLTNRTFDGKLASGDDLLVQVEREAARGKIPTLTTAYSITGKYVVLTRGNTKLSVSGKCTGKAWVNSVRAMLTEFRNEEYGLIVRTAVEGMDLEELRGKIRETISSYKNMLQKALHLTAKQELSRPLPEYLSLIRDRKEDYEIRTDLADVYEACRSFAESEAGSMAAGITFYEDNYSLTKLYGLESELEKHTSRKMWLPSGGFLVFEQTEALYVIDVNSGKGRGQKKSPEESALRVNLEAAEFIAAELRIRNISGMILIDFIDMKEEENRDKLLQSLRSACRKDPVPVDVLDITKLGIAELTRKKVKRSLSEQISRCSSNGNSDIAEENG